MYVKDVSWEVFLGIVIKKRKEGIPGTRMEKEWKKENLKNGACWRALRELRCSSLLSL